MYDFKGCTCSACGKPLEENDDIVVCPDCGAPYHRECYQKAGKCVFSEKHGTGFEYKRPEDKNLVQCPNCGAKNNKDNLFCENCGLPMVENAPVQQKPSQSGTPLYAPVQNAVQNETRAYAFGATEALPQEIDGIPAADWAQYIGNSAPYYLFQFQRMDEFQRKTSFCWSALLFAPLYFFFRKMWMWGTITALAFLTLSIPGMLQLLISVGMPLKLGVSVAMLDNIALVCGMLNWGLSLACALYAFYLFRKTTAKRLQDLKNNAASEDVYRTTLARHSGPSTVAVVCVFIAFLLLGVVLALWIGPERAMALYLY